MSRLLRLMRKELSESLRDRRTIFTLVLMPLLIYPVLAVLMRQAVLGGKADDAGPTYRVGFASQQDAEYMNAYWGRGAAARDARSRPAEGGKPAHLRPAPRLAAFMPDDPEEALRQGDIDVFVRLKPRSPLHMDPRRPLSVDAEFRWLDGSPSGGAAARYLEGATAEGNAVMIGQGLEAMGVRQRGDPVRTSVSALPAGAPGQSPLVPVLVPLILILMTMTGAVYPAIDLTAGERERGTLEILAAAPIPRLSVLLAKYAAVLAVALLTALANLGTMAVTLQVTGLGKALFAGSFGLLVLGQVLALLVLFAAFFSAVLLAVTSFARSFKEAQAYLIPLMLVCLAPGVMALLPGLTLAGPLAVVPLLNIVLLARDVLEGTATLAVAGVVVVLTLLYALAAIALAARIFATEAVLSSESSGWDDLLRRPERESAQAAPSAALLCLATLFPAVFLVSASLKGIDAPLGVRLLLGAATQVALFAGFPLVAAWMGRVRLGTGFRLATPPALAWPAAVLLGLGLWPFVHEAVLLAEWAGFSSLGPELRVKLKAGLAAWRGESPALLVLALAVLPAIVEELVFRGYLFAALRESRPWPRIMATAALFAAFHLFVSDALAIERLVPSLLMGVALGALAWASGSVWPGMLLHALHNATLVLLGYFEPALKEAGWLAGDRLPALALGVGAALSLIGGALLATMAKRASSESPR